ncbi:short-chain dehydrogenase [Microbacterium barkeri]|uniref:Short-chain dehydrogenase n=1 Tax=Microbacterium barkeri TaxID=33917 RepID=A0A9W6H4K4_9MICO|nr:SDR family NAD(P)-dependent oxidoreductase [Microbacterium barkeri]MDI6944417.1 SDR family NAD(P)-dependent oxidoreductase [Microbacterium barkeri]MDR6877493.1 3-oxoacyl-[acyl-carrier protein] reductase [Microbacterium barkeri]GLJ62430.1 short-chain dehydrogenase [Microbacterium barkeri]
MTDAQVTIISGAASGIGRATAVRLAGDGHRVVIGRFPGDPHDAHETLRGVESAGGEGIVVDLDVASTASTDAFAEAALAAFGRIDHVVANAGILRRAAFADMTDEAWDAMLQVDLHGVMRLVRAAIPHLSEGSSIVAISSIAGGVYGWEEHAHYATAKAGVLGLVRSIAVEFASRGIRANAIIPGLIESPQSLDAANSLGPDGLRAAGDYIPWGRVGRVEEVASVAAFLLSRDAAYVSGQSITVDGGLTVAMRS